MQNVLIVAPEFESGPAYTLLPFLRGASHKVVWSSLDGGSSESVKFLCAAFSGLPPDIIITDLTKSSDILPLRHTRSLLKQTWGDEMPTPISLALINERHLQFSDWPALVDDFILPGFVPAEAIARIKLLLFKHRHLDNKDLLTCGDVTLDLLGSIAKDKTGTAIPLTSKEFSLLRFLCTHRGKFFSRDQLLDLVWGVDYDGGDRTVDIHMSRLRTKLPSGIIRLLETRRGVGYGLIPET
jgi:DNA-binding response OmpR family regulator